VKTINADSSTAAQDIMKDPSVQGRVTVLNLAGDEERGGGWGFNLSIAQVGLYPSRWA
jgi:hypothetical protein